MENKDYAIIGLIIAIICVFSAIAIYSTIEHDTNTIDNEPTNITNVTEEENTPILEEESNEEVLIDEYDFHGDIWKKYSTNDVDAHGAPITHHVLIKPDGSVRQEMWVSRNGYQGGQPWEG